MTLGEYLKQIRLESGLSLREAAKRSNISPAYLSQLENDQFSNPGIKILIKLERLYQNQTHEFLKRVWSIQSEVK